MATRAAAAAVTAPRWARTADARALAGVAVFLLILSVLSWRRWGNPAFDAGVELEVASLVADGVVPYADVRYFYGPAAVYGLALAFKALGTSLTVAWAFGYLQTAAILGTFYALARVWLAPLVAALATTIVTAIGFSGSMFNFVLPHSSSATLGLLFLLALLLALARDRPWLVGLSAGALLLTRPEFVVFGLLALVAAAVGRWRERGVGAAARLLAIPVAVAALTGGAALAYLAARVGASRLFTENLFPLDFIAVSGATFARTRAPFTAESFVALGLRGALYAGLVAGLVLGVEWLRAARGARRALALVPPFAAVAAVLAVDGLLRVSGLFDGARREVEDDIARLLIAMSWLPALALAGAAWAAWRLRRGGAPPLGRSWPADLALVAVAAACGLRTYADFTTDVASVYYAPLPVLLAAVAHQRLAEARPRARVAALAPLALIAGALAFQGWYGRLRDHVVPVHSARGTYLAPSPAGQNIEATLDLARSQTAPGTPILVVPDDGGLHFLADRPPVLYDINFLPGHLHPLTRERAAIAQLRRKRPPLVVFGSRRFRPYGYEGFGVDYNRELMAYVRRAYRPIATFGDFAHPPGGAVPSQAFRIYERRQP